MSITRTMAAACVLAAVTSAWANPSTASAVTPTKAQELRSRMSPDELRTLREELAKMKARDRWPIEQQDRYLRACEAQRKQEPSINRRTCECILEAMMGKYSSFGEYAKDLVDHGGPQDETVIGLTGACLAAFGD